MRRLFTGIACMLCYGAIAQITTKEFQLTISNPSSYDVKNEPVVLRINPDEQQSRYASATVCVWDEDPASVLELPAVQSGANTNLEEILALNPQVVVMSDMAHTTEQVELLEQNGIRVIGTDANSIEEVYANIRLLGMVMGKEAEAEALVARMQQTFADVAAKCGQTDKTIYFEVMPLEWGLWSAGSGTFMHELAEICGMKNAFADIEGWQQVSQEQVIERNPDYIVLVTGMGEAAVDEVMARAGWEGITAIQNGDVYNADSYAMTRPAPRLMEAVIDLYNFLYDIVEEEMPAA